jgi:hypothetical protein
LSLLVLLLVIATGVPPGTGAGADTISVDVTATRLPVVAGACMRGSKCCDCEPQLSKLGLQPGYSPGTGTGGCSCGGSH